MARLPTKDELSRGAYRSAPMPTVADQTGAARGLAGLGAAVADIGDDIVRQRGVSQIAGAEADYTGKMLELERNVDNSTDYGSYGKTFEAGAGSILESAAKRIADPAMRQKWIEEKKIDVARRQQGVLSAADGKQRVLDRVNLGSAIEAEQNIFTDLAKPEQERMAALGRIRANITAAERTGLLDPALAEKWRKTYDDGSVLKEAELRVLNDSTFRDEVLSGDNVVDRIIGVESGGNPNAKNPKSSATGAGQFIDSTWLNMIRQYRPDLMEGRSTQEVLALRSDPKISREMTQNYANENAQFLKNQGIQATDGNIYLAHFLGPRGAAQVLKADPGASVEGIVGAGVVNANPFLRGKSAGDVAAWAAKKMGGNPLREGIYAGLSPEQRQNLYEVAQRKQSQDDATASALLKQRQMQEKDNFSLLIANNDPSLTRSQILSSAVLDNGDKAALLRQYDDAAKEGLAIGQAMPLFAAGRLGEAVDPYSEQGRKLVNGIANTLSKTLPPEQHQSSMEELTRQSGYVPQPYFNGIRSGLASGDVQAVAGAAQAAVRINSINPNILGRSPDGGKVQDAATSYQYYTQNMGLSPEQAAQKLIDANDPAKMRDREAILKLKAVSDGLKKISASDVKKALGSGWFTNVGASQTEEQQRVGINPDAEAVIVGDFRRYVEEAVTEVGGDLDMAKKVAGERFQRIYGTSAFNPVGSGVIMRYPVEKAYPADPSGSYGWIGEQAIESLKNNGIEATKVYLLPLPDGGTERDLQAGKPARYQVFYEDGNGSMQQYNLPFHADVEAAQEVFNKKKAEIRAESERRMIENRADDPMGTGIVSEEFGNSKSYRGIARVGSPMERAISKAAKRQAEQDERTKQADEQFMKDFEAGAEKTSKFLKSVTPTVKIGGKTIVGEGEE